MILDIFTKLLDANIPGCEWRWSSNEHTSVVISPTWPEFGEIEVEDDGDELMVFFGKFTHSHFSNYEGALSLEQREERIAADLVQLLQEVFADRIEFYGSSKGGGGFRPRGMRGTLSKLGFGNKAYVWSGQVS